MLALPPASAGCSLFPPEPVHVNHGCLDPEPLLDLSLVLKLVLVSLLCVFGVLARLEVFC